MSIDDTTYYLDPVECITDLGVNWRNEGGEVLERLVPVEWDWRRNIWVPI